ncbi:IS66 family insertion sequence element accessory protein TnpB [Paraburkholderia terricola]|uniref:IS66 family insertion sequence element accessory protein TnpB n=1 Tax=Paraburkholderia terricola TaxID=169427 RepID=UPI003ECCD975
MFRFDEGLKVYLHRDPVDFRYGMNSLSILVEQSMRLNPMDASLYVFGNRRRDQATFSIPIEVCHNGISMASIARPATSGGSS